MTVLRRLAMILAALTAAVGLLPAPASASSGYPRCSDVWVVGKYVTKKYEGCRAPGTIYAGVYRQCDNGKRLYTSPDDRKWVIAPGRVEKGGPRAYAEDFDRCLGL